MLFVLDFQGEIRIVLGGFDQRIQQPFSVKAHGAQHCVRVQQHRVGLHGGCQIPQRVEVAAVVFRKFQRAGEFIVRYHLRGEGRLFVTTNLAGEELEARYTMRVCSRLKDLMVPLHLKGADKRRWGNLFATKEGGRA